MSNGKKKLRIALIGLGDIAEKAYLPIIANHEAIEPIFCTRNKGTLNRLSSQYRIFENYHNLAELLNSKPDAVMVHTSTESHYKIAKQIIEAGIACFIDKPISYQYDECEELVELARTKKVPFYIGFNRRFAPLISPLNKQKNIHIRWQKNRVNLPEKPREYIYNDFIHVVDGLRFLAGFSQPIDVKLLKVTSFFHQGLLANIHFIYHENYILIEGCMNRLSGTSEERLEVFNENSKVEINNLTDGVHYQNNAETKLNFNDWQSYLYTRGFVDMIEDWLHIIQQGFSSDQQLDDILLSHQMCEKILMKMDS
jgi:virulence factor